MPILYLMPCASFLNRDFAFGDQGVSPLEPDRQGAGAVYEIVFRNAKNNFGTFNLNIA